MAFSTDLRSLTRRGYALVIDGPVRIVVRKIKGNRRMYVVPEQRKTQIVLDKSGREP